MRKIKIIIAILIGLIILIFIYTEVTSNAVQDNADIADSAIHDYCTVSLVPEITTEETTEEITEVETEPETETEPDIYQMAVWDLGLYLYGISYLDTSRSLKLITYEGYGYSPLSYYVACCCWSRATENYWGYSNLYSAFGEADTSYDTWMDDLGIADYAYDYLRECYFNPSYIRYCNGMATPSDYIYYENGIYVWN